MPLFFSDSTSFRGYGRNLIILSLILAEGMDLDVSSLSMKECEDGGAENAGCASGAGVESGAVGACGSGGASGTSGASGAGGASRTGLDARFCLSMKECKNCEAEAAGCASGAVGASGAGGSSRTGLDRLDHSSLFMTESGSEDAKVTICAFETEVVGGIKDSERCFTGQWRIQRIRRSRPVL